MANTTSIHSLLAQAYATTLAGVLAQRPSTTVVELRELLSEYPQAGSLTLAELLGGTSAAARPAKPTAKVKVKGKAKAARPKVAAKPVAPAAKPVAPAAKPVAAKPVAAKPVAPAAAGWNVRTDAGRAALQHAVLEALRSQGGTDIRAEQLRSLGAAPAQLRATLNKLIQDGAVTFTGQARGTRYSLV